MCTAYGVCWWGSPARTIHGHALGRGDGYGHVVAHSCNERPDPTAGRSGRFSLVGGPTYDFTVGAESERVTRAETNRGQTAQFDGRRFRPQALI